LCEPGCGFAVLFITKSFNNNELIVKIFGDYWFFVIGANASGFVQSKPFSVACVIGYTALMFETLSVG
jgi:hypothetical protein